MHLLVMALKLYSYVGGGGAVERQREWESNWEMCLGITGRFGPQET